LAIFLSSATLAFQHHTPRVSNHVNQGPVIIVLASTASTGRTKQ
jgi:hypothetical protein